MNQKLTINPPFFHIERPDLKDIDVARVIEIFDKNIEKYKLSLHLANDPYLYWDTFKHKAKPSILTAEEQWFCIKQMRAYAATDTPIQTEKGSFFKWGQALSNQERFHTIDMLVGGQLFAQSGIPAGSRESYITRGVIEEAIASSQLEGAHTTRAAARQLLVERRSPKNESERMIVNNYRAMTAIEEDLKNRPLSLELLFELHSILTEGTVKLNEQKRLRKNSDNIVIQGQIGHETFTTHIPPDEKFLQAQITRLIAYANDELQHGFVHPIVKAIFIHFWIGYLHPFVDGNGRLARALFYWYVLKNDYWAFSYIPISTVIKKSPMQYAMAYIYSEQDDFDLTYFFEYHMRKIIQAMGDFESYLEKQVLQNKRIDELLGDKVRINDRQKQLIHYFIFDARSSVTATSHATINNISRQTAAKDLQTLEKMQLVVAVRDGKFVSYVPTDRLKKMRK